MDRRMCGFIGTYGLDGVRHSIPVTAMEQSLLGSRGPDETAEFAYLSTQLRFYRLGLVAPKRTLDALRFPPHIAFSLLNGTLHQHHQWAPDAESDHEALGIAFASSDNQCWQTFNGGFAACIQHRDRLVLATDALGEKSLCWTIAHKTLWFSTSALLLAQHLGRHPRTGDAVLNHLAFRGQPLGSSYFTDIRYLPPGHVLTASSQGVRIQTWPGSPLRRGATTNHHGHGSLDLRTALASRMTDGVAGVALSGGLDSSLLTVIGHQDAGVQTCASLSPQGNSDLLTDHTHAHLLTAELPGIHHVDVIADTMPPGPRDFPVLDQDEHGLDAIAAGLRSEGCNLLIAGDGADELFCGYDRIFRFALSLDQLGGSRTAADRLLLNRYAYTDIDLLADGSGETGARWKRRAYAYFRAETWRESSTWHRTHSWFLGHHLFWLQRKLDFVAGRHGMEARSPYLHADVVGYARSLAVEDFLPAGIGTPDPMQIKSPLKLLLGDQVPEAILIRPKLAFPARLTDIAKQYRRVLGANPEPALPPDLHEQLLTGNAGTETQTLYFSYLTWLHSCRAVLN